MLLGSCIWLFGELNNQIHFRPQNQAKAVCGGNGGGHQGLTFTVDHVGIEFETDLAETQEGAVGVDALAVEAHVVFAALVHLCGGVQKRKDKGRQRGDTFRIQMHC